MELRVIAPAYGLPSIDPECVAAVALVKSHCEAVGQSWTLVATHENDDQLPILRCENGTLQGIGAINRHLNGGKTSSSEQDAKATALKAFIQINGQPLLDISLYVSFENYRSRTRSAFTRTLPWYANYIIPPRRREAAMKRTEHLGISTLDMDNVHESVLDESHNKSQSNFEHATETRARTLLGRRETIASMLKRPEYAGAFRLEALADALYEPLAEFLGDKDYLLDTNEPSVVDCIAYGYLSLMRYPQLLQSWSSEIMTKKYPRLVQYVERLTSHFELTVSDATMDALFQGHERAPDMQTKTTLPWRSAPKASPFEIISYIGSDLSARLPLTTKADSVLAHQQSFWQRNLSPIMAMTSASLVLFGYWLHREGLWPHGDAIQIFGRKRLADYGAAGAALAALGGEFQATTTYEQQQRHYQRGPVEVDVVVKDDLSP